MVRTHSWAERCLAAHKRPDQALFGIIQGGLEPDLRAESTRVIASMPFDGICIGGLAGDETARQRREALDITVPLLADDPRPRYLMGLGSPADLLDAVDAGVDMFDSVLPARVARNGTLWVPEGRLNLRNSRFLDDDQPIQEGCRCRACRSFTRAYLAHLLRADELLFYRLATCHNLTFVLDFMAAIRQALAEGRFPEFVQKQAALRDNSVRGRAFGVTRKLSQSRSELPDKRRRLTCRADRGGGRNGIKGSTSERTEEEAQGKGFEAASRVADAGATAIGRGNQAQAQAALGRTTGFGRGVSAARRLAGPRPEPGGLQA